ncbi:hypothetical protein TNCV_3616351 [Trichonephila clavipes]|nr:hypothetical protein TNCV_3616351 [Trichonephila clavipes]
MAGEEDLEKRSCAPTNPQLHYTNPAQTRTKLTKTQILTYHWRRTANCHPGAQGGGLEKKRTFSPFVKYQLLSSSVGALWNGGSLDR